MFYTVKRNTVWHITDKYNILIIITDGRCKFTSEGKTTVAAKGDAYFVPAGTAYEREPINDEMCTMIYIHFIAGSPFEICTDSEFKNDLANSTEYMNTNLFFDNDSCNDKINFDIFIGFKTTFGDYRNLMNKLSSINLFSSKRACKLICSINLQA